MHEFLDVPTTAFSSADGFVPFHPDPLEWWGQVDIGTDVAMSPSASLYANAGYDFDFDGRYKGYDAKAGVRWTW
jgi:outer membrane autotransporter protein